MKIHILYSWIGFKGGQPPSPLIITYVSNYKKNLLKSGGLNPPPSKIQGGSVVACLMFCNVYLLFYYTAVFFFTNYLFEALFEAPLHNCISVA